MNPREDRQLGVGGVRLILLGARRLACGFFGCSAPCSFFACPALARFAFGRGCRLACGFLGCAPARFHFACFPLARLPFGRGCRLACGFLGRATPRLLFACFPLSRFAFGCGLAGGILGCATPCLFFASPALARFAFGRRGGGLAFSFLRRPSVRLLFARLPLPRLPFGRGCRLACGFFVYPAARLLFVRFQLLRFAFGCCCLPCGFLGCASPCLFFARQTLARLAFGRGCRLTCSFLGCATASFLLARVTLAGFPFSRGGGLACGFRLGPTPRLLPHAGLPRALLLRLTSGLLLSSADGPPLRLLGVDHVALDERLPILRKAYLAVHVLAAVRRQPPPSLCGHESDATGRAAHLGSRHRSVRPGPSVYSPIGWVSTSRGLRRIRTLAVHGAAHTRFLSVESARDQSPASRLLEMPTSRSSPALS